MKAVFTGIIVLLAVSSVNAADLKRGKMLHQKNCSSCHVQMFKGDGTEIYTRKNHKVNSLAALGKQVRLCTTNLNISWYDDEIKDVIHYLNTNYYKYK